MFLIMGSVLPGYMFRYQYYLVGGLKAIVFGSIRWCVWSFRPSSPLRLPHLKCLLLLLLLSYLLIIIPAYWQWQIIIPAYYHTCLLAVADYHTCLLAGPLGLDNSGNIKLLQGVRRPTLLRLPQRRFFERADSAGALSAQETSCLAQEPLKRHSQVPPDALYGLSKNALQRRTLRACNEDVRLWLALQK